MKKARKMLAAILSLGMICSLVPNVSAGSQIVTYKPDADADAVVYRTYDTEVSKDEWFNGPDWKSLLCYRNGAKTPWNITEEGMHLTRTAHEGRFAMVFTYNVDGGWESNRFAQVINTNAFEALEADKTYRIGFWHRGTAPGGNRWKLKIAGQTITSYTKGQVDGNWTYYYTDVTGDGTATQIAFETAENINLVMDDLTIKPVTVENDTEVLGEDILGGIGDFENFVFGKRVSADSSTLYTPAFEDQELIPTNWVLSDTDTANDAYMKVVSGVGHTGNNALYLYNTERTPIYWGVRQNMTLAPGNYVFEFWVKGWKDANNAVNGYAPAGYNAFEGDNVNYGKWSDWKKVTVSTTLTADKWKADSWLMSNNIGYLLIDDIALYKDGDTSTNLFANGSFESASVVGELKNPLLYPVKAGGAATLTWKNPGTALKSAAVTVDGAAYEFTPNLAANGFNEIMISGLTNDVEHTVVLDAVIGGNKKYSKTMTVTPCVQSGTGIIGEWSVYSSEPTVDGTLYYSNYNVTLDKTEKTDDTSLRFDANINTKKGNLFIRATQTVKGLSRNKLYRLKFDAKMDGLSNFLIARDATGFAYKPFTGLYDESDNIVSIYDEGKSVTRDWQTYTVDIVNPDGDIYNKDNASTYDMTLSFTIEKLNGSLWIDNVELYEITEDGVVASENLMKNSTFSYDKGYSVSSQFTMLDGDEEVAVSYIPAAGIVTAKALIKNFAEGEALDVIVFAALYNGDKLENVTVLDKDVQEKPILVPADEITATVTVPALDTGDYKIKLMVWDGTTFSPVLDNAGVIAE